MRVSPADLAYMAERQGVTCRGCIFADPKMLGSGHPCCRYGGKLEHNDGVCLTKREA